MGAIVPLVCLFLGVRAGEPLYRPTTLPSVQLVMAAIDDEPLAERGPWPGRDWPWQPAEPAGFDLRRHLLPRIRDCFNRALKTNPAMNGRMKLHLHAEEGRLRVDVLENTVGDQALALCITGAVERTPVARGSALDLVFPIHFSTRVP